MFHLDLSVLPSIRSLLVPFLSFFFIKLKILLIKIMLAYREWYVARTNQIV